VKAAAHPTKTLILFPVVPIYIATMTEAALVVTIVPASMVVACAAGVLLFHAIFRLLR
jgi:hypothetical protein